MFTTAVGLIITSAASLALSFFWPRMRTFLLVMSFFALLNSYFAAPLHWKSFLQGKGFRLAPLSPRTPPIPLPKLALPTDPPEEIILKMGCYVCHQIPKTPESYQSDYGPILILGTMASLQITSEAYQEQVRKGVAEAGTPREYVIESILYPNAFIATGYADRKNPERSLMYPHYAERFTRGGLETLVDYLLTLDIYDAMEGGLALGHSFEAKPE